VRARVHGSADRPRLSVFRSNRGIHAQLIDDYRGHTVAAVNWTEAQLRGLSRAEQARRAGELIAQRAQAADLQTCVLDRRGYKYHGLVQEFADGARSAGLAF
jgi:large subunit ribosomal protein L18